MRLKGFTDLQWQQECHWRVAVWTHVHLCAVGLGQGSNGMELHHKKGIFD